MTPGEVRSVDEYRTYARRQIRSLVEALTRVMFGDFSVVARTPEPDEDFGYLCAMINVAINAARNAHEELRRTNDTLEQRVQDRTRALQLEIEERKRAQAELIAAQDQLVQISRQAGMAEVATGVLHNVGNVLNSVNVSANLLIEYLQESGAVDLGRVVAALREHEADLGKFMTDHPLGQHFVVYLEDLDQHLSSVRQAMTEEATALRSNLEHVKEIVAAQQDYAGKGGINEELRASALMEESLRLNSEALERHGIEVMRHYETEVIALTDRHRSLQVLVNLVSNAKYACAASGRSDRRIDVRVDRAGACVRFIVADNGIGIPPENLIRIFSHGFTTRQGGHGFGLRSAALTAKELGGSLTVHSDGLGKGAAFVLELPATVSGCAARCESD